MPEADQFSLERMRPPQPADREHFVKLYARCGLLSCEYSFGNLLAWGEIYDTRWCEFRGATVIHLRESDDLLFPVGAELSAADLAAISAAMRAANYCGAFFQAPTGLLARRPELGEFFRAETTKEEFSDYLHLTERLAELKGAKLNKKRNLIRQFERNCPDAAVRPLGPEHATACLQLTSLWAIGRSSEWLVEREDEAIAATFRHFTAGFEGVGLFRGESLLGFCVYSRMGECAVVHFEKTLPDLKGAAQMINNATARSLLGRCKYINREQDLNLPGLRHAKRSYDPDLMYTSENLLPK